MENQMERIEETLTRMHETLLELDPTTPEFKTLVRDIEELTKLQMELKNQKPERVMKYILGLVPAATTFLLYGWAFWIDNSDYIKPKMCTSMERWTSPWKK